MARARWRPLTRHEFGGGTGAKIRRSGPWRGEPLHGYSANTEIGEYHIDPPSEGLRQSERIYRTFRETRSRSFKVDSGRRSRIVCGRQPPRRKPLSHITIRF